MNRQRSRLKALVEREIELNLQWVFRQGHVPPHLRNQLTSRKAISEVSGYLLYKREVESAAAGVDFYLFDLREIGGKEFPFVLCLPEGVNFVKRRGPASMLRKCFVGCRFGTFREELTEVLQPILSYYGYKTEFSDTGFQSGQVFDKILKKIGASDVDFAIFDNRGTETKPNVYIEVGAAYALGVPHFLLEYRRSVVPSNLHGFLTLRYSNYRELAREFSLALPQFLEGHKIKPPAQLIP